MTGRDIIDFAARAINALEPEESLSNDLFEDSLDALKMLMSSWSAEELMPHDYAQVWTDLYSTTPSYTLNDGAALDSDSICVNQKPIAGGTQSLSINGAYASSGVATLDVPRHVIITSTGDESGRTFTIMGTSGYNDTISEVMLGPNAATKRGAKQFKTITSITIDGDSTGILTVGTDYIIDVRRPVGVVYAYLRDSDGYDTPLKIIDRPRYEEISDKGQAGTPTRLFYNKSAPSGEIYLHPVPAGGLSIDVNVGTTEHITNGDFSAGTDWTLGSQWAITGNKLVRTPGTGDPILSGVELIDNGAFDTTLGSWFYSTYFEWSGGKAHLKPNISDTEYIEQNLVDGVDLIDGESYYVSCDLSGVSNTSWELILGGETLSTSTGSASIYGIHSWATGEDTSVRLSISVPGAGLGEGYVDNISCQLITGYSEVGVDSAKQLAADLAAAFTTGHTYRLTFTVSSFGAGTCTPSIGGTDGATISADGSYSMDIICGTGADFELAASSDFSGTFDDISIFEVTDDTATVGTAYKLCLDLWLPFVEITTSNADTDINLPGAYLLALRWNLAADLAPEYGKNVSSSVYERAKETKDIIKMLNGMIPKWFNSGTPTSTINGQPAYNQN